MVWYFVSPLRYRLIVIVINIVNLVCDIGLQYSRQALYFYLIQIVG